MKISTVHHVISTIQYENVEQVCLIRLHFERYGEDGMREDGMKYLSKRSLIKHTYS